MGWGVAKAKRILIVDDHAALRMALRHVIESVLEFEVCGEAENGREGIERAGELQPDLIVLDLSMPVMNGFEAARELKALLPSVPLLLYTSFVSSNVEDAALAAGVSKVASKSSPPEALVEDLRTLLKCAS
jgi:DNA-binding NarL/FixJ family response regulator